MLPRWSIYRRKSGKRVKDTTYRCTPYLLYISFKRSFGSQNNFFSIRFFSYKRYVSFLSFSFIIILHAWSAISIVPFLFIFMIYFIFVQQYAWVSHNRRSVSTQNSILFIFSTDWNKNHSSYTWTKYYDTVFILLGWVWINKYNVYMLQNKIFVKQYFPKY